MNADRVQAGCGPGTPLGATAPGSVSTLLHMTDPHGSRGGKIRPFGVPITRPFAQVCAAFLSTLRDLTGRAVAAPVLAADSVFRGEVEALAAAPDGPRKEARLGLHRLLLDAGHLTWAHAVDHVRALEHDVLMRPPPVWSPLALARVTLEGLAFTHYLYDPSVPLERRLARAAGLVVTEAHNEVQAAKGFGPEEQAGAQARKKEAEQLVLAAGAVARLDRSKRVTGYAVDGESARLDHRIGEQTRLFLPSWAQASYPLLSGAAHGRPWMIARARSGAGWEGEAATVMAAVMTVAGALESGIATRSGYLNLDVGAVQAEMAAVREAFVRRSAVFAHAPVG